MSVDTQAQPAASLSEASWVPSPLHRFTLEQYEELVESGVFSSRDRFHLIDGIWSTN
jgi:hypothetical protein